MNKLCAKVKFKKDAIPKDLITIFFQDFNPENSIVITKDEINLKIAFDKINLNLITALLNCDITELICGEDITKFNESEKSIQLEQNMAILKNSVQIEQEQQL